MGTEVWILGGTGRSGRAIAAELVSRDIAPVLVGRDAARLAEAARQTPGGPRTLVAGSMEDLATQIGQQQPAVVINTIGPFTTTAPPIVQACLQAGSDYLDLANDVAAVSALLALNEAATIAGRTIVTGAGFGVTATESVVVKLTQDEPAQDEPAQDEPAQDEPAQDEPTQDQPTPTPARVRVDMVPSLASEAGPVGAALAGTILEGLPGVDGGGRFQGRRYKNGRLAPARIGGDVAHLVLPDGSRVTTAGMPLGELIAAQRASGAPDVVAASSEAPSAPVIRAIMPLALALLQIAPVRAFATNRLARVQLKAHDRPREHSYGHAVIQWPDGTTREGWLQLGDAQAFTGAVPAEIARRLLAGQGRPGAHTPAALFGSSLAEACGARYLIPADAPAPA
jgi:Saccharopine dehydrogenase NADP binding domain